MGRQHLLDTISHYRELWDWCGRDVRAEEDILGRFSAFVANTHDCFERTSPAGHVTGSALVVSDDLDRVLLTLHRKLGKWLQLGGHADGDARVHAVAYREAIEESGLSVVRFFPYEMTLPGAAAARQSLAAPLPFDFDCHVIPARKADAEHVHYDVRYLMIADPDEPLRISDESSDLAWFTLGEARQVTDEPSMHRQFDKVAWLRQRLDREGPSLTFKEDNLSQRGALQWPITTRP